MIKRSLIALSALALLGAGCWFGPAKTEPEWVEPEKPEGVAGQIMGNWKITSLKVPGESLKNVSDLTLLVGFAGQNMNAKVCNSMSGTYTVNGIVLKAPSITSTKMFCAGDAGKVETAFTSGLATGFEVTAAENTITLTNGQTVLVLTRE
ncbi:META domain-containing protein [Patescibacteria group bacterium]|jgi:heat shock protein HslJ|nr:META domain-containing protein [Patescibacteria group bacterium]